MTTKDKVTQFLQANPNRFTVKETAAQLDLTYDVVNNLRKRNPQTIAPLFATEPGGKLTDADDAQLQRIETLLVEQGYRPNWSVAWAHLEDGDTKTTVLLRNPKDAEQQETWQADLIADIKKHAPTYKKRKHDPTGEHALVLPMADIHIGKYCNRAETSAKYDIPEAVKRAKESTDALVAKAQMFGVKNYILCIGNDIVHTEDGKATTAGTPQDTDGSWFEAFRAARSLYVSIIEQLALHGDVLLVHVPSNHDWRVGYSLADAVAGQFVNHPNVNADLTVPDRTTVNENHRKYVVFGHNLLMFSHGDGAKEKDTRAHITSEAPQAWADTTFRYAYYGHLHHKIVKQDGAKDIQTEKDQIGFTEIATGYEKPTHHVHIEYVRSPSEADPWHHRNGYVSKPAMEAFLHHPTEGQVARFTHFF